MDGHLDELLRRAEEAQKDPGYEARKEERDHRAREWVENKKKELGL